MTDGAKDEQKEKHDEKEEVKNQSAKEEVKDEAPKDEKPEKKPEAAEKKNSAFSPRLTTPVNPTECSACGKHLIKKLWYYRNNAYYCSKTCFNKKTAELKEKALEEENKAKEHAAEKTE